MGAGRDLLFNALASGYHPEVNDDIRITPDGQVVDAQGNPTTYLKQPSLYGRIFNPEEANYVNNLNNQSKIAGLQAQQENAIQRGIVGQQIDTLPYQDNPNLGAFGAPQSNKLSPQAGDSGGLYAGLMGQTAPEDYHNFTSGAPAKANVGNVDLSGKERQAWITQTMNPHLEAGQLKPNLDAQGAINTGLIGNTGGTTARMSNVLAHSGLNQAQFESSELPVTQNTTDAINSDELRRAQLLNPTLTSTDIIRGNAALGRANTEENTKDLMTRYDNTAALFGVNEQGLNQSTKRRDDLADNYKAGLIGQRGTDIPFAASVDDNGGVSEIPGLNSSYANMIRLANAKLGQSGGSMVNGPAGGSMPARPVNIPAGNYMGNGQNASDTKPVTAPVLGVSPSSPNVNPPSPLPLHIEAASNALPAKHLEDAEQVMKTLGLLHDEELFKGTGRNTRRITDSQEESLIKSRLPLLMKQAQNPHMRPAERALIGNIANQFE